MRGPIQLFSTSPQSLGADCASYVHNVIEVARWSERAGCAGILVYTDNSIVDPWLVSQIIVENTASLSPLVAVQPVYMHPYTVAKMVTSIAFLHNRRLHLNMVAGGFKNDLVALDDRTPHDRRYERLVEYVRIISSLLKGGAVSFEGEFYKVDKLILKPPLPARVVSGHPDVGFLGRRAGGRAGGGSDRGEVSRTLHRLQRGRRGRGRRGHGNPGGHHRPRKRRGRVADRA